MYYTTDHILTYYLHMSTLEHFYNFKESSSNIAWKSGKSEWIYFMSIFEFGMLVAINQHQ